MVLVALINQWWYGRDPSPGAQKSDVSTVEGSPQIVELAAVVRVFKKISDPFNLVTDSAYVGGIVMTAEASVLKEVEYSQLFYWLQLLVFSLENRTSPYFVMHIRSHTNLPGILAQGNRQADLLAVHVLNSVQKMDQAKLSHSFFLQNAAALLQNFGITKAQASVIITVCPDCQRCYFPSIAGGVNPPRASKPSNLAKRCYPFC